MHDFRSYINAMAELADQLPNGYEINLSFFNDECSLKLYDPDGEEVEVYSDSDQFTEAVRVALEHFSMF